MAIEINNNDLIIKSLSASDAAATLQNLGIKPAVLQVVDETERLALTLEQCPVNTVVIESGSSLIPPTWRVYMRNSSGWVKLNDDGFYKPFISFYGYYNELLNFTIVSSTFQPIGWTGYGAILHGPAVVQDIIVENLSLADDQISFDSTPSLSKVQSIKYSNLSVYGATYVIPDFIYMPGLRSLYLNNLNASFNVCFVSLPSTVETIGSLSYMNDLQIHDKGLGDLDYLNPSPVVPSLTLIVQALAAGNVENGTSMLSGLDFKLLDNDITDLNSAQATLRSRGWTAPDVQPY